MQNSQSDSALDEVFQQAQQQQETSGISGNEPEENLSTDSSIPAMDEETGKVKKKQRFHFPSFGKRIKINKI